MELVVFPKVLEKYTHLLSPDTPIAAIGELSVTEDGAPKLLVSAVEILQEHFTGEATPLQKPVYQKREIPDSVAAAKRRSDSNAQPIPSAPVQAPAPSAPQKPKTLYLKVPGFPNIRAERGMPTRLQPARNLRGNDARDFL